ncbi:MAG: hypothetical protein KY469_15835 [Actinobacteria bacterium]|nr:hypothetical protein [Actinomycetota bacterium]
MGATSSLVPSGRHRRHRLWLGAFALGLIVAVLATVVVRAAAGGGGPDRAVVGAVTALSGTAECRDGSDDARTGGGDAPDRAAPGTDLRRVALEVDGSELVVTFEMDGDVPAAAGRNSLGEDDLIQWVVWTLRGEQILYQLRVALDGDQWETTFDVGDRRILVSDERPDIVGNRLRVAYDLEFLPDLGDRFGWVALSVYDDPGFQDVCPDRAHSTLDPDVQLPFGA